VGAICHVTTFPWLGMIGRLNLKRQGLVLGVLARTTQIETRANKS
jgi:hypothetical protein